MRRALVIFSVPIAVLLFAAGVTYYVRREFEREVEENDPDEY
jgi:uncharacterized protein YneF (UPF0154 family)